MANTFLNTGRSIVATSNPKANLEQVQTNSQPQTVQNNGIANQTIQNTNQASQSNANNAINPITIPIQIQPQVANQQVQGSQQQVSLPQNVNVQPPQNTNQTREGSLGAPAPSPQEYKPANNNNVIDFNQIYSSYKGNNSNNTQGASGIKKTSIGTTIVTPRNNNLNTAEGMYQSAYSDTINSLISEMLSQVQNGFQYDPAKDTALQLATEYAANSTMQSLAGSGVLNSSATAERVARIVSELVPEYEKLAYSKWTDYLGQLANTAQIVMTYDNQQFEHWKDAKDREFQNKQFEYQKQQDALTNAWKRVDELGYVDNNASAILGVPVGTLSGVAREAKEQREFELAKMREQAQIEYENNKALYKLKAELDKEQQKYAYELQKQYGGTKSGKSNTTSLSTYQDIINNRWAKYDEQDKKYSVANKNEVLQYLDKEYQSGRLSDSDAALLISYYNLEYSDPVASTVNNAVDWLKKQFNF